MFSQVQISVDLVAILAAIATALAFLHRMVFKPAFKWTKSALLSLQKIDVIHEQMFTNGGSTLRDAVNRIESRLNLLEKKQSLYILDTPHGVYETNKAGEYTAVNRTFCRSIGKSENEALGRGWLNSIAEHDRERVDNGWRYAVENSIEYDSVYDMVDSGGYVFKVRCKANPIKSADGFVMGYIGVVDRVHGQA